MPRNLGVLGVALAAAVFALSAAAGDVRGTDPAGDLKTPKLTRAERAALDIRSVRVVGEEGLGAFVTVTFAGNVERLLGTGHLKEAVIGLLLEPKASSSKPAGLLTHGAGLLPRTVRVSPTKQVSVKVTTEESYRRTRSTSVGVVRNGRQLFVFVAGPGFSNVAAVDVRSFASLPERKARSLQQLPPINDQWWVPFANGQPTDDAEIEIDPSQLTVDQLNELKQSIEDAVMKLLDDARPVETAIQHVDDVLRGLGDTPAGRYLKDVRDGLDLRHDQLFDEIRSINGFKQAIEAELRSRVSQPELDLEGSCTFFDPLELMCSGQARELMGLRALSAASPVAALRMVVPGGLAISAFLCPAQLPSGSLSQTSVPNDTLTCAGGTLALGHAFSFNLRTVPPPTAGMGVQVSAQQDGAFKGPFAFSGP